MFFVKLTKFKRNKGITIFESLVVIASLLIIMAIALPLLNKFKEVGKRTQCLSNLKQFGMAFKLYENDYLFYPKYEDNPTGEGDKAWDDLFDYLGYIEKNEKFGLLCATYLRENDYSNVKRTYAVPKSIFSNIIGQAVYIQSTDIQDQNNTILVAEVKRTPGTVTELEYCERTGTANADIDRHTSGANYLFFDGHAAWHNSDDTSIKWEE